MKVLIDAFEDTLRALKLVDRQASAAIMVTKINFELAKEAERDPVRLRDLALQAVAATRHSKQTRFAFAHRGLLGEETVMARKFRNLKRQKTQLRLFLREFAESDAYQIDLFREHVHSAAIQPSAERSEQWKAPPLETRRNCINGCIEACTWVSL